jgi:hypothetical protein
MLNIFIDESGTFTATDIAGSWNVVAALVFPNSESKQIEKVLQQMKVKSGLTVATEIKLGKISNNIYLEFLNGIADTKGTLHCVAIDSSFQSDEHISNHRDLLASNVAANIDRMKYSEGAEFVRELAKQVQALAPQLYSQMHCQVQLLDQIMRTAILYHAQRTPKQLNKFRWRIDEKSPGRNVFQDAFRAIVVPLLQSSSLSERMKMPEIYSRTLSSFTYNEKSRPNFLKNTYNIDAKDNVAIDVGKLVWDDFQFMDSKLSAGIQVADLLASGLRKCLRGEFSGNDQISNALGAVMVDRGKGRFPIELIGFTDRQMKVDTTASQVSKIFKMQQRPMRL